MNRTDITTKLSQLTEQYINSHNDPRIYWAKEVTFDYGTTHQVRVDYMRFKPSNNSVSGIEKGDFYCYEVKSCAADFNSKNGHNFIGDFNYYVMTKELYKQVKSEIPYNVGVLVQANTHFGSLESIKKAKRMDRKRPICEMLLMMFRSANRDKLKSHSKRPLNITNENVVCGDVVSFGSCPSCGYEVSNCMKYCVDCGQVLNWKG